MAGTDTTAFAASLKNVYIDGIREQINQNTTLLDLFTEGDVKQYEWQGKALILDLHTSRNASGVKYVAENGGLPIAGSQGTANLTVPMSFLNGRIQFSAQVMKASRSSKGAFISAQSLEQKGLVNDVSRQRNRALAGFGQETLAVITTGANSTTQALKNPGGVAGTVNPARFILPGQIVVITDPTGATVRGVSTVLSVSQPNMVLAAAINSTTNDLVSLATTSLVAGGEGSFGLAPMGILGIVDSTTYVSSIMGLDRSQAANAYFRSTIMSSVGNITPDVLQRGTDNTWEVSSKVIDQYISHVSVRRELIKLTEADRRYAASSSPQNFDAGSQAGAFKKDISFNGVPVRADKDFAYGTLIGVTKAQLLWFPETKGEWVDEDGNILFRVQNTDSFEARYRLYENFCSDEGAAHVRFDGITATVSSGTYSG